MTLPLPELKTTQLTATREYLQDMARVIGKVQQTFIAAEPHEWQRGLQIENGMIMTRPVADKALAVVIDVPKGVVRTVDSQWKLGTITGPELLGQLTTWLKTRGVVKTPEEPEYLTTMPYFDLPTAQNITAVLDWADQLFSNFKQTISGGLTSPLLLFPHHFDLSLVWFPFGDDTQLSFGFSFGDEYIDGPYFYTTTWPEPVDFGNIQLASPAYWHTEGFLGVVLKYADLLGQSNPDKVVMEYCSALLISSRPLLKPSP